MLKPAIFQLILLVNSSFLDQFPNILFCIFSRENLGYHRYFLTYVAMMHWKFHTKVLKFCFRAYALYFSEKFRELVGEINYAYDWSSHWPSPSLLRSLETCRFSIDGSFKLRSWLLSVVHIYFGLISVLTQKEKMNRSSCHSIISNMIRMLIFYNIWEYVIA